MASVDWDRKTAQEIGAQKKHLDKRERKVLNHSNKNINKELTGKNYIIVPRGVSNFDSALERAKKRTENVDAILPPLRVKKDRTPYCVLVAHCPLEIEKAGKADDFFKELHKVYMNFFGEENVHASFVHKDEKTIYKDSETKEERESLFHAHTLVSCFVPGKGINGKLFETKARYNQLNNAVNEMSRTRFGVPFLTGEKARKKKVEKLKEESAIIEEGFTADIKRLTAERDKAIMYKHNAEIEADNAIKEAQKAINAAKTIESESFSTVERAHNSIVAMQQEISNIETAVEKAVIFLSRDDESDKIKFKNSIFGKETVEMPKDLYDVMRTAVHASSAIRALNDETKKSLKEIHETAIGKTVLKHEKTISDLSSKLVDQRQDTERFQDGMEYYRNIIERLIDLIHEILEYLAPNLMRQFGRELNSIIHDKDEFGKER